MKKTASALGGGVPAVQAPTARAYRWGKEQGYCDWLEDEVSGWRRYGIDTVVSLLTDDEEQELGLRHEASEARKHDWPPISSIQDIKLSDLLETIQRDLEQGRRGS